ncbi:MAG: hypothetical protein P1U62_13360, partial [Alteraurantiacibacter sp. bin_em_oilr2.035]|nr:hypothetical protein [Alteraurantiacibacter sp. bin_em_oilr2.035]
HGKVFGIVLEREAPLRLLLAKTKAPLKVSSPCRPFCSTDLIERLRRLGWAFSASVLCDCATGQRQCKRGKSYALFYIIGHQRHLF